MGGCASKPKESDILEESAPVNPPSDAAEATKVETETAANAAEATKVDTETAAEEKADEGVVEKKEVSADDGAEKEKEAEAASEAVKTAEAAPADTTPKETPGETEPPKEEATEAKDAQTEKPLVTL